MAKVLLVEDDTNLSEIYQARLEAEGYIVVAAPDGETALAVAAKEKPDLIISDVMMPKISGFEMLDILRNTDGLKHTKVIMLTALGQAEDKIRAEQLGADRYLVKSQVTLEDIVSAAQTLLTQDDALPTSAQLAEPVLNDGNNPAPSLAATQPVVMPLAAVPAAPGAIDTATVSTPVEPTAAVAIPDPVPDQPAPTGPLQASEPVAIPNPGLPVEAVEVSATDVLPPAPLPLPGPPITAEQAEPQSTAQEAAAVQDKITGYENQELPPAQTVEPVTLSPVEQPVHPQPVATGPGSQPSDTQTGSLPASNSAAVIDESVVANAIDKLLAKSPAAQTAVGESSGANGESRNAADSNNDDRQSKKVIAPLPQAAAPSLQELLAKEEAKSRPGVDPNNIAL